MSGSYPEEPMAEVTRRAVALLSAADQGLDDLLDDDDIVWEIMGDTREQKISTVMALIGFALAMTDIVSEGNTAEMLRYYGETAETLDQPEGEG